MEDPSLDGEDSQEIKIDPKTLAPDLYVATKNDDLAEVVRLIDEHVPPTHVDKDLGWTALHWAAKNGNPKMAAALLQAGASGPYHRQLLRTNQIDLGHFTAINESTPVDTNAGAAEAAAAPEEATPEAVAAAAGVEAGAATEDAAATEPAVEGETPVGAAAAVAAAAAAAAAAADEDEPDEDELGVDKAMDYTKNTPLLWATFGGNLRVIWLLLMDGYSPNDVDDLNNNALHLAAASGNKKVVKVLVEDGTMPTAVNIYKNRPVDMTCDEGIREVLLAAMKQGASMTDKDIQLKHRANTARYRDQVATFEGTVQNLNRLESPRALRTIPSLGEASAKLAEVLQMAKEEALDEDLIVETEKLLENFDLIQELYSDIELMQTKMPISTQGQYIDTCHTLEVTVAKCVAQGIPAAHMNVAQSSLKKCQVSLRLCTLEARLMGLDCAQPENHHDMVRLDECVRKAQALNVPDELVMRAATLFKRLDAEEKMSIALATVPDIRLPMEEPPEDYWRPSDTGHVESSYEDYPLPPVDADGATLDYTWVPAETYLAMQRCIAALKGCTDGAEEMGANEEVRLEAVATLKKCEKDMKALDGKNEEDKEKALDVTTKAAKKLKKGKGKKK